MMQFSFLSYAKSFDKRVMLLEKNLLSYYKMQNALSFSCFICCCKGSEIDNSLYGIEKKYNRLDIAYYWLVNIIYCLNYNRIKNF